MSNAQKFLLINVVAAAACWGQTQVATASAPSSFTLRGTTVTPEQGVPSWPVLAGDTIASGTSPVTSTFSDGSTISLSPKGQATLGFSGTTPTFRLVKGTMQYSLKSLTSVHVFSGNQAVALASVTGTLGKAATVASVATAAGTVAAAHSTAVILASTAAAGLGVGVSAATSGGKSVSPSH